MRQKTVINVRGTLLEMGVGASNAITLRGVRGDSLRKTASSLRDVGGIFHVSKIEDGFRVWRER